MNLAKNAVDSLADFREQCRRQLERPIEQRIKYGFFRNYKPVLDDAPCRVFHTMQEYRQWAAQNLPEYLGFRPAQVIMREDSGSKSSNVRR